MVELAITFLGFFMMIFGVMEFSMAIYAYDFCYAEAQETAHYASLHGSQAPAPASASDLTAFVKARNIGLNPSLLKVTTTWDPDNNPGSTVTVKVAYTIVPLIGAALRSNLDVSATAGRPINN